MKKILAIIRKETLLRFASPIEWLFFLILPVVFTVVLAGGTGGSGDNRVRLIVVDQAQTPVSEELVAELEQSPSLRIEEQSLSEAESEFSQRSVAAILILPEGLELSRLQDGSVTVELRQQPNNLDAQIAQRGVMAAAARVSSAVDIAGRSVEAAEAIRPFESEEARSVYFDTSLAAARNELEGSPERVVIRQGSTRDEIEYNPQANSSAGQLITWVFVPLLAISSTFAFERENGTLRRFLTTPTSKSLYLLGIIASFVLAALVQMLLLVIFGEAVLGLNWGQSPAALGLMLASTALAGAALGTLMGSYVRSDSQASNLSIMLGMVMALLGGCWYPLELFPEFVRTAVMVLPTRWAMEGMLDIVARGLGVDAVLPEATVLLGFALVFFIAGVKRFRFE